MQDLGPCKCLHAILFLLKMRSMRKTDQEVVNFYVFSNLLLATRHYERLRIYYFLSKLYSHSKSFQTIF